MATHSIGGALHARRMHGLQVAFGLTALIVLLRFAPGPWQGLYALIEHFSYDFYFDHRPIRDASQFVIIGIDEDSLKPQHLGRFPWNRSVYAQLLPRLKDATVVAFDLLFSEPSPDDAVLAEAIRKHGRVVLAAHKRVRTEDATPTGWSGYGAVAGAGLAQAAANEEFVPPVAPLLGVASGVGYVDIEPDVDGVYRRVKPLQVADDHNVFPHFSTEIARVSLGLDKAQLAYGGGLGVITIGSHALPLTNGRMLINYAGPHQTVTHLSFWKVLAGKYGPETFRDKVVIIGPTAAGLYDIRPAPFTKNSRVFFGVETNANIARTLLTGEKLRDMTGLLPWGAYALLVGLVAGWVIWWHPHDGWAAAFGVGVVAILALPAFMLAAVFLGQIVPYGAILLGTVIPMSWALYERLTAEKRQVAAQFGTYVSPDVLRELAEHPEVVRQGQRRTVTLLFSDVRGSTTLCENIEPDVWIAQLNEYLSEMSDAIFAYDGYLDKFMGDGIMALWNAFGNQPDHAQLATKAAVQMLARLKELNADWEQREDRVCFQIGIGLHTGDAIIGNVGSDRRTQYTAIGDTVNTASRIEALTKDFKAQLIISETTAEVLGDQVKLVELGEAELKGREKLSQLRDPTSLRPWLRRSAVRRVAARRQRQFATQQLDDRVWAPVDSSLGMDLAAAVASLPIRERQALGLVYGLGYSEAETAATLGIRRGTVASSLFRARRKLAMALADYRDRGGR